MEKDQVKKLITEDLLRKERDLKKFSLKITNLKLKQNHKDLKNE